MDTTTIQNEYREMKKDLDEFHKRTQDKGKHVFLTVLRQFFDTTPEVSKIIWTQYTPYFNDGDTCEFGVNDPVFLETNSKEADEDDDNEDSIFDKPRDYYFQEYAKGNSSKYVREAVERYHAVESKYGERLKEIQANIAEVKKLWNDLDADVFHMSFGDHVKIVASKDSIDISDYEHD